MISFDRGTVWWVDLPLNTQSHVQGGARPCVIVSNPADRSGVVTVCPLSTKTDAIATHPKVFVKKAGQVLVEQITTVDIASLGNYVGTLSEDDMNAVNDVIVEYLTNPRPEIVTCESQCILHAISIILCDWVDSFLSCFKKRG